MFVRGVPAGHRVYRLDPMGCVVPVPRGWSDVSPAWMTTALAARLPGVVVERVDVDPVHEGTNARARVRVFYGAGDGPPSIYVKLSARIAHRAALLVVGALATEARLATCGLTLPLRYPLPYAGGVAWGRLATVLVMEDVCLADGHPNDATAPLTVSEVRSGLAGLAALHAGFWQAQLPTSLRFLRPWRLGRVLSVVSAASLTQGLRRWEEAGANATLPKVISASMLGRQFRKSAAMAAAGEQTVLHGDPHPGNTYSLPGARTGFLDWQLARTGNWSHDVGYFLVASLDIEERRAHERQLLAGYLDELGRGGVAVPEWEQAWDRYRATPAFGLATWLHTLAFGTFQPTDVCVATIRRFAAAYDDLDAAGAIAEVFAN